MSIRPALLVLLVVIAAIVGGVSGGLVARAPATVMGPVATETPTLTARPSALPTASVAPGALPDIPGIIARVAPSVVTIDVVSQAQYGPRTISEQSSGTGFVLTADGAIGTCAHVVAGAQQITVTLADGATASATVVGADTSADLAVITIKKTGLVPIATGRSGELRVGDLVIAVGNGSR